MPQCNVVIGIGRTPEEALLYARVNQCCDNHVKDNTISKKTDFIEIPGDIEIDGASSSSKIIMAIHFASSYYMYQQDVIHNPDKECRGFTESEYKYYSILIRALGSDTFKDVMRCYYNKILDTCIAVRSDKNQYKFLY
jgi:hypothetical protein